MIETVRIFLKFPPTTHVYLMIFIKHLLLHLTKLLTRKERSRKKNMAFSTTTAMIQQPV